MAKKRKPAMADHLHEPIPCAPDFTVHELINSATAQKLGMRNTPDIYACARLIHIAQEIAQPARDANGPIIISSAFRSPRLNAELGGSPTSAHMLGAALDMVPKLVCVASLALWIFDNRPVWDQVIYERNVRGFEWVHVSLFPPGGPSNRGELRRHFPRDGGSYPHINRAQLAAWACARS